VLVAARLPEPCCIFPRSRLFPSAFLVRASFVRLAPSLETQLSGLAVRPNPRLGGGGSGGTTDNESDAIFRLAEDASAVDGDDNDNVDDNEENGGRRSGGPRVRRTITMVRDCVFLTVM